MVGTAVFTIVASRFSMNSATATNHGTYRRAIARAGDIDSGATAAGEDMGFSLTRMGGAQAAGPGISTASTWARRFCSGTDERVRSGERLRQHHEVCAQLGGFLGGGVAEKAFEFPAELRGALVADAVGGLRGVGSVI